MFLITFSTKFVTTFQIFPSFITFIIIRIIIQITTIAIISCRIITSTFFTQNSVRITNWTFWGTNSAIIIITRYIRIRDWFIISIINWNLESACIRSSRTITERRISTIFTFSTKSFTWWASFTFNITQFTIIIFFKIPSITDTGITIFRYLNCIIYTGITVRWTCKTGRTWESTSITFISTYFSYFYILITILTFMTYIIKIFVLSWVWHRTLSTIIVITIY